MFFIDEPTAATAPPAPTAVGAEGYFQGGNPAAGTAATPVRYWWLNMVQQELGSVLAYLGIARNKSDQTQVSRAVQGIARAVQTVVFTSSGNFTVPAGVYVIKARIGGGGGGAAGGDNTHCGSGGGAGGYVEIILNVTPGQVLSIAIGAGGIGVSGNNPAASGGTTSIVSGGNTLAAASGGLGGTAGNGSNNPGGGGGVGAGTGAILAIPGGYGSDGYYYSSGVQIGGCGGASYFGGGGRAAVNGSGLVNMNGQAPSSGAGGAYANAGNVVGGNGAAGIAILEF